MFGCFLEVRNCFIKPELVDKGVSKSVMSTNEIRLQCYCSLKTFGCVVKAVKIQVGTTKID